MGKHYARQGTVMKPLAQANLPDGRETYTASWIVVPRPSRAMILVAIPEVLVPLARLLLGSAVGQLRSRFP